MHLSVQLHESVPMHGSVHMRLMPGVVLYNVTLLEAELFINTLTAPV